jgi:small-conductance mechanosensitive channel
MTAPDDRFYDLALDRIAKLMFALGAGGSLAAWVWRGWTWGAGFALGSAASWLNYRWLKNVVDTLAGRRPKSKRVVILAGLRYLLLGGGAYVILRFSKISIAAALSGLFISAAAVIIEILIELLYARD